MKSSFLSLNSRDFIRGLFMAVVSAIVALLYTSIQAGNFIVDWKAIGMAALSAALAYITKNLLTNSTDELLKKEVLAGSSENPNT
jgi:uncharacterized membrane protein YvlD (DUF360 family)